jgi:hypothetical protein
MCVLVICAACAVYYRYLWPSYAAFNHRIDSRCAELYCDFSRYYYKQARALRTADRPIDGYYYSPTFALLLTPIGEVSLSTAWRVWSWVQAFSLASLLAVSARALRAFPRWTHALGLVLTLTSYPILCNWRWGQLNSLFIACAVLALLLHERGAFRRAAFALSWLIALRYYPALYALGFVARRGWTALVWCALFTAGLLVLVPVVVMGPQHAWSFYAASATALGAATNSWLDGDRASQYLPSVVQRTALALHRSPGPKIVWVALSCVLAAVNIATVVWLNRARVSERALWAFCLLSLSTPLLAATSWMHYFVYLPLAQTFLGAQLARPRGSSNIELTGLVLLWSASVVLSSLMFFLHAGGSHRYELSAYLLWSDLALLALAHRLLWRVRGGIARVAS